MYKTLDHSFEMSWSEQALQIVDEAAQTQAVQVFPEVVQLFSELRIRILEVEGEHDVGDLLSAVSQGVEEIVNGVRASADVESRFKAHELFGCIKKMRAKLFFLEDYFNFQVENFEQRFDAGEKFAILPSVDFMERHPQHKAGPITFTKRISVNYSTSFKGLADKMGFPVVVDLKNEADAKTKLAFELWRIYNKKNGFSVGNRSYKVGTSLPRFEETMFHQNYFNSVYGGFSQAIREIILGSEIDEKDDVSERLEEKEICKLLELSLKIGRVPDDIDEDLKDVVAHELEADLRDSIDRLSVYVEQEFNGVIRRKPVFNWRQLLVDSKYFSRYGVLIYDFWVRHDRIEALTNHPIKMIEKRLKDLFFDPPKLKHMRRMPALFNIDTEDVDSFDSMTKTQLIEYIEKKVLGQPFFPSANPTREGMKMVLKIFAENGISVAPAPGHFISYGQLEYAERIINGMVEKMKFFAKYPAIPLYMRQVLLAKVKTSVDELEATVSFFESQGIEAKWYVHFLHVDDDSHLQKRTNKIKSAVEDYSKIEVFHAEKKKREMEADVNPDATKIIGLLAKYIDPATLPSKESLAGLTFKRINRRVQARLGRGEPIMIDILDNYDFKAVGGKNLFRGGRKSDPVVEAKARARLIELGYPFEQMSANARNDKPSTVLSRAELMLELFGEVRVALLVKSLDAIREEAKKVVARKSVEEVQRLRFERLVKEKGWSGPPPYLKIGPARIMQLIDEIEVRGVPFQDAYWWWLNGSASQRDAQIEETWRKLSKDSRRSELAAMYGFDVSQMHTTALNAEPDNIRQYCKILELIGFKGKISWSWPNKFNIVRFRYFFRDSLRKDSVKRILTDRESDWVRRIDLVEQLRSRCGNSVAKFQLEVLIEEAKLDEVEVLQWCTDEMVPVILGEIAVRVDRKMELEALFRRYRFGYEDMDYFTASMEKVEFAFDRIAELEKYKLPVTREVLYRESFEVASAIGVLNDEDLNDEQRDVVTYLENCNCDQFWARKLARSGETVEGFRAKVEFFGAIRLDVEDYGKESLEISDYENLLDRPMSYIRRSGLKSVRMILKNRCAHNRLYEALGDEFEAIDGWRTRRTSEVTKWRKFNLLKGDVLGGQETIVAELVTGYSKDSVEGMIDFIEKVYSRGQFLSLNEEEKSLYIQIMVGVLHSVAKMGGSGIVSKNILDQAKRKIVRGAFDQDFVEKIKTRDVHGSFNAMLASIGNEMVLKVYTNVIDTMVIPKVPGDRFLNSDEEKKLALLKDEGDKRAADILVTKNLRLVMSIAKRYLWSGLPFQDLVQEGNEGLIKGVQKFDWKRGYRLTTCATWWIRAAIGRYVQNNAKGIRLPVNLQQDANRYLRAIGKFKSENYRMPEDEELAKLMGIDVDEVDHYRSMANFTAKKEVSLDAPMYSGDGETRTRLDVLGEDSVAYDKSDNFSDRRRMLGELKEVFYENYNGKKNDRDWDIFLNRFGFNDEEDSVTLEELGEKYGITREAVRLIEVKVLDFIKASPMLVELIAELSDK